MCPCACVVTRDGLVQNSVGTALMSLPDHSAREEGKWLLPCIFSTRFKGKVLSPFLVHFP